VLFQPEAISGWQGDCFAEERLTMTFAWQGTLYKVLKLGCDGKEYNGNRLFVYRVFSA
jgi:hypothetical protein